MLLCRRIFISFFIFLSFQCFSNYTEGLKYQQKGLEYRSINKDTSSLYLDSAFTHFVDLSYYGSASFCVSLIISNQPDSDTTNFRYLEILKDSALVVDKYANNENLLSNYQRLMKLYNNWGNLDSTISLYYKLNDKCFKYLKYDDTRRIVLGKELAVAYALKGNYQKSDSVLTQLIKINTFQEMYADLCYEMAQNKIAEDSLGIALFYISKYEDNYSRRRDSTYRYLSTFQKAQIDYGKGEYLKGFDQLKLLEGKITTFPYNAFLDYNISIGYEFKGEYDSAFFAAESAFLSFRKEYGENHINIASCYERMASVFYYKSDYGQSNELLSKAFQLRNAVCDTNAIQYGDYYLLMGMIDAAKKEYKQSKIYLRESYRRRFDFYGINKLKLAEPARRLGLTLLAMKQDSLALTYLIDAYEIYKFNVRNPTHIYFAQILNDLGRVNQLQLHDDIAIKDYVESLAIYRKLLGSVSSFFGRRIL